MTEGGHDIPADVVARRYDKGLANLPRFMRVVDDWYLYDNSGSHCEVIAKRIDKQEIMLNLEKYKRIVFYRQ